MTERRNVPRDLSGHELRSFRVDQDTARKAATGIAELVLRSLPDATPDEQHAAVVQLLDMLGLVEFTS